MTIIDHIRLRARHVWLTIVGALVLAYFSYHMIQGDHGVIALLDLRAKVAVAQTIKDATARERAQLEHQVALLRPDNLDPDMLEERSRLMLNYGHPDEIVIVLPVRR